MDGALSFNSVAMRSASLGPTPGARPIIALSPRASARCKSRGDRVESTASATLTADILHRLQQAEPFALFGAGKTIQADGVVADLHLDHQRGMRAHRQPRQS